MMNDKCYAPLNFYKPWEYVVTSEVKQGQMRIEVQHQSGNYTGYIIPSELGNDILFLEKPAQ